MPDLYTQRTTPVKAKCTPGVLYGDKPAVHDAYMAVRKEKKVVSRLKRPQYAPTFIRQWRKKRGKTQEQLAELVTSYLIEQGIRRKPYTHASIGRIETGKMPYSQPILEAIADALATTPASLLMRDPESQEAIWTLLEAAQPAERREIADHAEVVIRRRKVS